MVQLDHELRAKLINTAICGSEDHAGAVAALMGAVGEMLTRIMSPADAAQLIAGVAMEAALGSAPTAGSA